MSSVEPGSASDGGRRSSHAWIAGRSGGCSEGSADGAGDGVAATTDAGSAKTTAVASAASHAGILSRLVRIDPLTPLASRRFRGPLAIPTCREGSRCIVN
jgi:hypothetical protein